MTQLFLVYLGGRTEKSNIELHDVQFVAGDTIEDTYPVLREKWFGDRKGLHLDSYLALHHVDGYRVELKQEPSSAKKKLYFLNFGGYDQSSIAELHQFGMFVADGVDEAKQKGKQSLLVGAELQHKDDLFDVDDCFVVDSVGEYFVHLIPDETIQEFKPDWFGYKVIG